MGFVNGTFYGADISESGLFLCVASVLASAVITVVGVARAVVRSVLYRRLSIRIRWLFPAV